MVVRCQRQGSEGKNLWKKKITGHGAVPVMLTEILNLATGNNAEEQAGGYASTVEIESHQAFTENNMPHCLNCLNFNMRDHPQHVAVGFGRCLAADITRQGALFMPLRAVVECSQYSPAKEGIIAKRQEWYESRKGR